jgi:hypothetical protein
MEEELEDLDSSNETADQEADENLDTTELADESSDADDVEALKEKNRMLFARAKKAEAELKKTKTVPVKEKEPAKADDIARAIDERLERRELEDLDLGDELKTEVQRYAKLNNVSVKKALASDYILFQKDKIERARKTEEASLGTKGRATSVKDYGKMNPNDFDFSTEAGRAEFKKYEEHVRKQLG